MEAVEDPVWADGFGEVVAVEVRPCVPGHASESEADAGVGEIFLQLLDDSRGAVVDVGDRFGIDDEPADGGWRAGLTRAQNLVGESAGIRVEEGSAEAVEDQTRLGDGACDGRRSASMCLRFPGS